MLHRIWLVVYNVMCHIFMLGPVSKIEHSALCLIQRLSKLSGSFQGFFSLIMWLWRNSPSGCELSNPASSNQCFDQDWENVKATCFPLTCTPALAQCRLVHGRLTPDHISWQCQLNFKIWGETAMNSRHVLFVASYAFLSHDPLMYGDLPLCPTMGIQHMTS